MQLVVKLRNPDPIWDKYIKQLQSVVDTCVLYETEPLTICRDAEAMITTHINKETLFYFPALKKIFLFKTGMDELPLEEMSKRNISVNCSYANADVIAEHALSLALALLHRIPEFHNDLCKGVWYSDGRNYYWRSIQSFHIGILGFGHVGKSLYQKLYPLNQDIMVLNKSGKYPKNVQHAATFEELIRKCNLLFLCLPKTAETIDLFNEEIFNQMGDTYLINVSRAEICNERALFEALSQNHLAGYASDVWYNNPNKSDKTQRVLPSKYPFETLSNAILSPHCATHDFNAHERYIQNAVESCITYFQNKTGKGAQSR